MPESLLTKLSEGKEEMTLIGWAADGFPVYARYGYTTANDASSTIKVITGSYQTKATPDANRPSTDLYPMGAFTQDWEYVAGLGDLDECNGRTGVTPEFPEGIYHYYATDSYPFMSRCVKGQVASTGNQPPAGGPGAGGPGGNPPTGGHGSESSNRLTDGPPIPGPYGPLNASDFNRDGTVTRVEMEAFMDQGPYRRIGLVAFFDLSDTNQDGSVSPDELAVVDPPYAFDGTDANADGIVTRAETEAYVENRLYRRIGLGAFFDLVDTNQNDELTPDEIKSALETGLLTLD
jgi:hypothetical protein